MTDSKARTVRAPTGTDITAKSWLTEAPLRMIQNNLDPDGAETTESSYYLSANRNKRSVTVDMAKTAGVDLLKRMLRHCDVLVHNFKVGGLENYKLGYDDLKAEFPSLVYCAITGFGQTGPYAHKPALDIICLLYTSDAADE